MIFFVFRFTKVMTKTILCNTKYHLFYSSSLKLLLDTLLLAENQLFM